MVQGCYGKTVKAGFFCDFSSFSSCGKDWGVGERFLEKEPPRPAGTSRIVRDRLSRGGEFTLAGLGGEFSVDVVLCVNFMAYCCGHSYKSGLSNLKILVPIKTKYG